MRELWRFPLAKAPALLGLCLLILVGGCEDPSNVGLGLIGESGSDPVRIQLPSGERPASVTPTLTSNLRSSLGFTTGAATILTGSVQDPIFGTVSTKAYVDFSPSSSQSTTYRNGTITSVKVLLTPNYVYGDTVASTSLIVAGIDAAWLSSGLTSDTTLTTGSEITRVDFSYPDSTLTIDLPSEWYSAQSSVLLSSDVVDLFHGLEISTSAPTAVVGFSATSGILRITTTTGTADLLVSKIFTHIERQDDATPPPGRAIIQDGIGQALSMSFDFGADSVAGSAVSRAVVEIVIDRESMAAVPENFVRPNPVQFDFIGVRADGSKRVLRSAVSETDVVRFVSSTAAPGEYTIVRAIQGAATGNTEFVEYGATISQAQAAVSPILVFAPGADENAPKVIVTVTPNSF